MSFSRTARRARNWFSSVFTYQDDSDREDEHLLNTVFHINPWERLCIVLLGLLIVVGVGAATYLLVRQGKDPEEDKYTLVSRQEWVNQQRCLNTTDLVLPVERIMLVSTETKPCRNISECLLIVRGLHQEQTESHNVRDVTYNFIIAGDGRIYEDLGWKCASNYEDNGFGLLVIAILGEHNDQHTADDLVKTLKGFIENGVIKHNISSCYKILRGDSTKFLKDLALDLELTKNIC